MHGYCINTQMHACTGATHIQPLLHTINVHNSVISRLCPYHKIIIMNLDFPSKLCHHLCYVIVLIVLKNLFQDVRSYIKNNPRLMDVFANDLIKELLEEEIIPDTLVEALDEFERLVCKLAKEKKPKNSQCCINLQKLF